MNTSIRVYSFMVTNERLEYAHECGVLAIALAAGQCHLYYFQHIESIAELYDLILLHLTMEHVS